MSRGKERRLHFLEDKASFVKRKGKSTRVDPSNGMMCSRCSRFFLSQQGLFRHIVDKHASEIPKDSIFGPPPHLPPSSSPPAETDLAIQAKWIVGLAIVDNWSCVIRQNHVNLFQIKKLPFRIVCISQFIHVNKLKPRSSWTELVFFSANPPTQVKLESL